MATLASLTINRRDTFPAIKFTLEQEKADGQGNEPIDLRTALKVTLLMKTGATLVEGICTYKAPEETSKREGKCEYLPVAADTALAGTYEVQAEIEWPETAGVKRFQTVPSSGYKSILIQADLGTA